MKQFEYFTNLEECSIMCLGIRRKASENQIRTASGRGAALVNAAFSILLVQKQFEHNFARQGNLLIVIAIH